MRVEVIIWLVANAISFIVSLYDLRTTGRVWRWVRKNVSGGEMHLVAKRNFRAALFRFALATAFVAGGLIAVLPIMEGTVVWFLVAGAIILSTDIVLEARYRGSMFSAAKRRADEEHDDKRYRMRRGSGDG